MNQNERIVIVAKPLPGVVELRVHLAAHRVSLFRTVVRQHGDPPVGLQVAEGLLVRAGGHLLEQHGPHRRRPRCQQCCLGHTEKGIRIGR